MAFLRNFIHEFKKFAMRGNAIDMAVGIVLGTSFTNIVNTLVGKVFIPLTAYFIGNTDVSAFSVHLPPVIGSQKQAELGFGAVGQSIIQFLIVAFVMFLLVRAINRLNLDLGSAPVPEDVKVLREIRDLMKQQKGA